jgi:hypothetical protein
MVSGVLRSPRLPGTARALGLISFAPVSSAGAIRPRASIRRGRLPTEIFRVTGLKQRLDHRDDTGPRASRSPSRKITSLQLSPCNGACDRLERGRFSCNEPCPSGRASTIGSAFAPNDQSSSVASAHP